MTTLSLTSRLARSFQLFTRTSPKQRNYAHIAHLDERMLDDIGLTRLDVEQIRRHW